MDIASCYAFLSYEAGPSFDVCFLLWTVIPKLILAIPLIIFIVLVRLLMRFFRARRNR